MVRCSWVILMLLCLVLPLSSNCAAHVEDNVGAKINLLSKETNQKFEQIQSLIVNNSDSENLRKTRYWLLFCITITFLISIVILSIQLFKLITYKYERQKK